MNDDQLVLTVEEAAKILRISRAFAYELVARDELPHLRLGRRIVIPHAALKRMIDDAGQVLPGGETPNENSQIPPQDTIEIL